MIEVLMLVVLLSPFWGPSALSAWMAWLDSREQRSEEEKQ